MRDTLRPPRHANTLSSNSPEDTEQGSFSSNTSSNSESKTKTIVTFQPQDPENPQNWPRWKKWSIIGSILFVDLTVSFGASGFSPASMKFAEDMHVSSVVGTLGLSLYVAGLAWGPVRSVLNVTFLELC